MTPKTNHDVEISIYHDFLEDQGVVVDRDEDEEYIEVNDFKFYGVGNRFSSIGGLFGGGVLVGDLFGGVGDISCYCGGHTGDHVGGTYNGKIK